MIDRFNFYDFYGYLQPGFIFLVLMWLPFTLIDDAGPNVQLSSTVLLLLLGYVLGHPLQALAEVCYSIRFLYEGPGKESEKLKLSPSSLLLDDHVPSNVIHAKLSSQSKNRLAKAIAKDFSIEVRKISDLFASTAKAKKIEGDDQKELESDIRSELQARDDAYFLCRLKEQQESDASYAEQFEGLYALMRGLSFVFLVAGWYIAGWFIVQVIARIMAISKDAMVPDLKLSDAENGELLFACVVFVTSLLGLWIVTQRKRLSRHTARCVVVAFVVLGSALGLVETSDGPFSLNQLLALAPLAPLLWLISFICKQRCKKFAEANAQSTLTSYLALTK